MPQKTNPEIPRGYLKEHRYISPGLTSSSTIEQASLPEIKEISKLDNAELVELLQHFGVMEPTGQMHARAMEYVSRMSSIRADSPEFDAAVDDICGSQSRRGMIGLNRRIYEQWSSLDAIQGDVQQDMIWICEDDDASCEFCSARGGEIQSYADWQVEGPPGSAVCKGGDSCRCQLVVID